MLACALCALPVAGAMFMDSLRAAAAVIGLAAAAQQALSVNLFTLPSDMVPRAAIGSVVGNGGMCGAIGAMVLARHAGAVPEEIGSCTPNFIVAASACLLALPSIHLMTPRLGPVDFP